MFHKAILLVVLAAMAASCAGGSETQDDGGDRGSGCTLSLEAVGSSDHSLVVHEQVDLSVRLSDDCSGPVAGDEVEFVFVGSPLGAQLSAQQVETGQGGEATVTLTAGGEPGPLTVAARHSPQVVDVTFSIQVTDETCAGHCTNEIQDCGETGVDCGAGCGACPDPCEDHCDNEIQDCGEAGVDCGGECEACPDPCEGHCTNQIQDCGETGVDCGGGGCDACPDPCEGHCQNQIQDCGETGVDCGGGGCGACPDPCDNHCTNGAFDCGETGVDCGGPCPACTGTDDAAAGGNTLPAQMTCESTATATVTMQNAGTTTWYRDGVQGYKLGYVGDDTNPFLPGPGQTRVMLAEGQTVVPGASVTFTLTLRAPTQTGNQPASFQMLLEGEHWFGDVVSRTVDVTSGCGQQTGCTFPQGVPDGDFTHGSDNDPEIAAAVNAVMVTLSGCGAGSDCTIGDAYPTAQSWFDAVNQALRDQGYCAGQHIEGHTDEIAVSNTGCTGRWYGYHIFNYGGSKVVWNPGAQRGWWTIDPVWCP